MEGTKEAQPYKPTIMMLINDLVPRQVSHSDVCVCVFVRVGVGVWGCVCGGVWVWVSVVTCVSLQNSSTLKKKKEVSCTLATPTTCTYM